MDIARAAGVSRGAVSQALGGHPSIPAETRARIQKIATKLGYTPDPMLTALASYRHGRRTADFRGTIAWLAQTTEDFKWREIPHFSSYLEAARNRALNYGYHVEVIDIQEMGISWTRAAQIAKSRGINGIMLCPQPFPDTNLANFPWEQFTSVTFGYSISRPTLHSVAPAQCRATLRTMKELLARGYEKIGLVLNRTHDQKTDHNYLAGYLAARELHDPHNLTPPLLCEGWGGNEFWEWFYRHKPDALIACDEHFDEILAERGLKAPEDVGLACPLLGSLTGPIAGVCEDNNQLGAVAADFLISILNRSERGIPNHPQRLLVEGMWTPGRSLKALPSD